MLLARVMRVPVLPIFFLAHFSHHFATGALTPLLPWLRDYFQLDYFRAGLLVSAFPLVSGFSQLPMASIADRWGKTPLIGLGLLGVSAGAIGIATSPNFTILFLFLMAMGVAASTYHAPSVSFVTQIYNSTGRGKALGIYASGGTSSTFIAPAMMVFIASYTGNWRFSFLAAAIPAVIVSLIVLTIARSHERASMAAMPSKPKERLGILEIIRMIGILVAIATVTMLILVTVSAFLPLYLVDKHGVSKEVAGLVPSIVSGASMLGAPIGGALSDRIGRKPVLLVSVFMSGPLLYFMTLIPVGSVTTTVLMVATILAVYGFVNSARMPTVESYIADAIPLHRRSSAMALYFFLSAETGAVTTPFVGLLANSYGLDFAFTTLALIGIACSGLVLLLRNKL